MTASALQSRSGLLVSVRSAAEAHAALEGGAQLIDVKEPQNGALGRATDATIAEVVAAVAGRALVSAALGELIDDRGGSLPARLSFVKWGLAGCASSTDWRQRLQARRGHGPEVVAVAYADGQCARAPSIDDIFRFATERPGSVLLVDTHCKEAARRGGARPTLLDWIRPAEVEELCARCRAVGVRIALAGSLGTAEIAELWPACPDWFAVRGAACEGGRDGDVSNAKVAALVRLITQRRGLVRAPS
jgi:(5-formylfuran-3-yl)methyl phosphate synthase